MTTLKNQIIWCARAQIGLVGISIALVGVFYFGIYRPQTAQVKNLADEDHKTMVMLTSSQSQAGQLPIVEAQVNRLRTDLADYKTLPTSADVAGFMSQITVFSRDAGLSREPEMVVGTPQKDGQFIELPVTMKFSGNMVSVFNFLRKAEDMQRLTRVSSIILRSTDARGTVSVELCMNLYCTEG
jgi:Tfp pilus assembly protein PilO